MDKFYFANYEIRITFDFMKELKEKDKRYTNSYKCTSSAYNKAMRRAKKEKGTLSKLIELVVIAYGYGMDIKAHKKLQNGASALDIFSNVVGKAENFIQLHNSE